MSGARPPRLGALDLLRGFTVAAMIVVNNPGNWNSVFPQLTHAAWDGLTFADLIFPAFLFIMGVAVALGLPHPTPPAQRTALHRRILLRGIVLIVLGLVLNVAATWPQLDAMRIPGVLQRIGATYAVAALIAVNTTDAQQWALVAVLMLSHWAMLAAGGSMEVGHNLAATLDHALFGTHLLTPDGDPEGALGLITCVATTLLGVIAGRRLRRQTLREPGQESIGYRRPALELIGAGAAAIVTGYAWSFVLPLNKALWTASYALLTSGAAALSLGIAVAVDRGRASRAIAPLFWLGTNPLAVYFLSELVTAIIQRPWLTVHGQPAALKDLVYWDLVVPLLRDNSGAWSSLLYAVAYTLVWIGVAGVMRWRGVRVRV